MVGNRSDFVVSTETTPKLPFESSARMVTVDCSPEGPGTILPSTNTETRRPAAGAPGAGFALHKMQAAVARSTRDVDGIGRHDRALFSGSSFRLLAHHTRDLT